jgi:hypothetical protein
MKTNKLAHPETVMLQPSGDERKQTADSSEAREGLKGLIAKLRWAGLDQDAEKLCHELETLAPADCVAPGPLETD